MYKEKYLVNNNLKELNSSGFEIRDGEPDIRGWKVKTIDNYDIGKVSELLFDMVSFRVRYLVLALNGKPLNLASRDVLIPIGLAELRRQDKVVLFPEVTVGHFASLPEYKKGNVTVESERAIRTVFAPSEGVNYKDADLDGDNEDFYNHEHFDEERMYKSRNEPVDRYDNNDNPENVREFRRIVRKDDQDLRR